MKGNVMPQNVQLNEETKKQLQNEVSELSETLVPHDRSRFTAVELWNRQKQSKSASFMIRRWNLN